jgi:HPt (histidine-containing phosphotransfer) domain-containing protein
MLDGTGPVDRCALRRHLHTLLGSAGMVGARQVELIAHKLQAAINAGQREVIDDGRKLLKDAMRSFEIEFDRRIESSADERDWTGRLRQHVSVVK